MCGSLLTSLFLFPIAVMILSESAEEDKGQAVPVWATGAVGFNVFSLVVFGHMWVHVYCLDECGSWWFSEMLVIILFFLGFFFYVTRFTRKHQKFLSIALASYIPSVFSLSALPLFASLKVSPTALSFCILHSLPLSLTLSFLLSF